MKQRWKCFMTLLFFLYLIIIYLTHTQLYEGVDYNLVLKAEHAHRAILKTKPRHSDETVFNNHTSITPYDETFKAWSKSRQSFCDDRFVGFDHLFAILQNVSLDPVLGIGPRGGEPIESVLNRPEKQEFLVLKQGYFQINCKDDDAFKYRFEPDDHLAHWRSVMRPGLAPVSRERTRNVTVAVTRYEYANLYHTMTDWYNTFLMLLFFNVKNLAADILFIDGHPEGGLDSTWSTLFGKFVRVGQLKTAQLFWTMIWNIQGYKSPMYHHQLPSIPHIESFRLFFLRKHNISFVKELNCDGLNITFLWRRDYVAHPRNPKGTVSRKVKNEKEIEDSIHSFYPNHSIHSLRTENMSMHDQLSAIVQTDVLIGMHGAGLTLALFLPRHAGLIELYPKYWSKDNVHFKAIARWRRLHYLNWQNVMEMNEHPNHFTYLDPSVIKKMLSETITQMCKSKDRTG